MMAGRGCSVGTNGASGTKAPASLLINMYPIPAIPAIPAIPISAPVTAPVTASGAEPLAVTAHYLQLNILSNITPEDRAVWHIALPSMAIVDGLT